MLRGRILKEYVEAHETRGEGNKEYASDDDQSNSFESRHDDMDGFDILMGQHYGPINNENLGPIGDDVQIEGTNAPTQEEERFQNQWHGMEDQARTPLFEGSQCSRYAYIH